MGASFLLLDIYPYGVYDKNINEKISYGMKRKKKWKNEKRWR